MASKEQWRLFVEPWYGVRPWSTWSYRVLLESATGRRLVAGYVRKNADEVYWTVQQKERRSAGKVLPRSYSTLADAVTACLRELLRRSEDNVRVLVVEWLLREYPNVAAA